MTTLVTPGNRPSHTSSVSTLPLSPECPQLWTEDVDNIGDNSSCSVRFGRSVYLSPSVDRLWTGLGEPIMGRKRTCGRNRSHCGRTTDVLSLSPDLRPPSTRTPTANPQGNSPRPRANFQLYTESTSPMTTTTHFHQLITTQPSRTPPWISPIVFVNRRLSWVSLFERTRRPVRKGADE